VPLAPVTVTVKVPLVEPVQERTEVADVVELVRVTLVADSVHVSPVDGETVSERVTVPAKLFSDATVIVEVPAAPTTTVRVAGLAATLKSAAAVTV
jgi:hypothetical protein